MHYSADGDHHQWLFGEGDGGRSGDVGIGDGGGIGGGDDCLNAQSLFGHKSDLADRCTLETLGQSP